MILFNQILLMLHFVGLAMGLSVGLANMTMAGLIARAELAEKPILGRFPLAMGRVGKIGLTLLWLTGLILVFTQWGGFSELPDMFWPKFTAVVVLTVVVGYIHHLETRIRKGDASALKRIQIVGKVSFALGLTAVVLAVISFS